MTFVFVSCFAQLYFECLLYARSSFQSLGHSLHFPGEERVNQSIKYLGQWLAQSTMEENSSVIEVIPEEVGFEPRPEGCEETSGFQRRGSCRYLIRNASGLWEVSGVSGRGGVRGDK